MATEVNLPWPPPPTRCHRVTAPLIPYITFYLFHLYFTINYFDRAQSKYSVPLIVRVKGILVPLLQDYGQRILPIILAFSRAVYFIIPALVTVITQRIFFSHPSSFHFLCATTAMGPYKLDPPRLKTLRLDAVERFKKVFAEVSAHDNKIRAFPLLSQEVLDHVDIEQQVNPITIRPANTDGSTGTALKWPDDYQKNENNQYLFELLERHAQPGEASESEALLRQVQAPRKGLHQLQLTDLTTPIATFQRRQTSINLPESTATSIFTSSFLSTQPALQTIVEDSKPKTLSDAVKHVVLRMKQIDAARALLESVDLKVVQKTSKPKPDHNIDKTKDDKKDATLKPSRFPCLGCGAMHQTRQCPKGPWIYTKDYKVTHKTSTAKPVTADIPEAMHKSVDRMHARMGVHTDAQVKSTDSSPQPTDPIPCYQACLTLPGSEEAVVEKLFWDNCLSHPILDSDIYDEMVRIGAEEIFLDNPVLLNTWTQPLELRRYITVDVTFMVPSVDKEMTSAIAFYRGTPASGSGISHTCLSRLGLHTRLQQLADQRSGSHAGHARRGYAPQPIGESDVDADAAADKHFVAAIEEDWNPDDELPVPDMDDDDDSLKKVLKKHKQRFPKKLPKKPAKLKPFRIIMIDPNQHLPYRRPRRYSNERRKIIRKSVEKLIKEGVIDPSKSPIASTVVLARKPDMTWRFCVDYRAVNAASVTDATPLPRIDDVIEQLRGKRHFAVLDLRAGYHQLELHKDSRKYSAFTVADGLYEFNRVPFGFKNAPGHFMQGIRLVLHGLLHRVCEAYLDDIVIWGDTIQELSEHLDQVLTRFQTYNIVLKASKCKIGLTQITYLGHVVDADGVRADPDRVAAIADMPAPTTTAGVRSFLGTCQFVRGYVQDFARIATPLTDLLKKDARFIWQEAHEHSFQLLKAKLQDSDSLAHFDPDLPTQLRADASLKGLGGVLLQEQPNGDLRPVAYTSRTFSQREQNWSTIEQECFALVHCVSVWHHYLAGQPFCILTDHRNLTYLSSCASPKVQRWAASLMSYNYSIRHIAGRHNEVADHLSRHVTAAAHQARLAHASHHNVSQDDSNQTLIAAAHNSILGHGGIERTLRVLTRWGFDWPGRRADVEQYLQSCPTCQAANGRARLPTLGPSGTIIRHQPFERYAIDLIGPFPPDASGNQYILLVVDSATRFVELLPLPNKTAQAVADGLISLFGRYGAAKEIHHDNGREFVNNVVDAMLSSLGIAQSLAVPYRPQTNGQAERHVQEVTRHIRNIVYDNLSMRQRWAMALPIIQRIINATVLNPQADPDDHVSPVELLFAGRVSRDRHLFGPTVDTDAFPIDAQEYIAHRRDIQDHLLRSMTDSSSSYS